MESADLRLLILKREDIKYDFLHVDHLIAFLMRQFVTLGLYLGRHGTLNGPKAGTRFFIPLRRVTSLSFAQHLQDEHRSVYNG